MTLRRIFIALYFICVYVLYICESNSAELPLNLFIIIIVIIIRNVIIIRIIIIIIFFLLL